MQFPVWHCSDGHSTLHSSQAAETTLLSSGTVDMAKYQILLTTMHAIIAKQKQLKGKEKLGNAQQKSHFQRTPAFLLCVLEAALGVVSSPDAALSGVVDVDKISIRAPQGGFTDVGKHTGTQPKATCWPTLTSTLKVNCA